jgi:UDP-hydrolysing UDP-N-acetyl-D-glucosamine 2-epimerase
LQGGEVSGNIDDRVRHAITKLADLHFVCSEESRQRVVNMGEDSQTVFNFGCPAMDVLKHGDLSISNEIMSQYEGVGHTTDWAKPYILMLQHPVTTSYGKGLGEVNESLHALSLITDIQKVVMWPNIDAGSDQVSKGIRLFREKHSEDSINYHKNFTPEGYARVLNNACCCVGNSSSFLREGAFLGVPVVLVGDRQKGREHSQNIVYSDYNREEIASKIKLQIDHGRYPSDRRFGEGDAGVKIAKELASISSPLVK